MSGVSQFNHPAFHEAARLIRALGYHVENPAENTLPERGTWRMWMQKTIAQLVTCDVIVLLPGWERSCGARIEFNLAIDLGIRVVPSSEFIT